MIRTGSDPFSRDKSGSIELISVPLVCRYEVRRLLGKGGFGLVYLCRDLYTGEYVAVKTIPAAKVRSEALRVARELEIMMCLSNAHPHVMSVLDVFATPVTSMSPCEGRAQAILDQLYDVSRGVDGDLFNGGRDVASQLSKYAHWMHELEECLLKSFLVEPNTQFDVHIVMPVMHGDLHSLLSPKDVHAAGAQQTLSLINGVLAVPFAFQICFGVDFLHKCNVVHRDLKPDNILAWIDGTTPLNSLVLVSDFGLARDQSSFQVGATTYVCTRFYRPPEVVLRVNASDSSLDIWSLGCILFELITTQVLFALPSSRDANNRIDKVRSSLQLNVILAVIGTPSIADVDKYGVAWNSRVRDHVLRAAPKPNVLEATIRRNVKLSNVGDEELDLWIDAISSCLKFFPEQRCTAEELCRHPLFRRHSIFYSENVMQFESKVYFPSVDPTTMNRDACQRRILEMALARFVPRTDLTVEEVTYLERVKTPPLAPLCAEDETPPPHIALNLPPITNPKIRTVLEALPTSTDEEVQAAIATTVALMEEFTHESQDSMQLQAALRFFATLRDLPQTVVVDNEEEEDDVVYDIGEAVGAV